MAKSPRRKCIELKITKDLVDLEDSGCAKIVTCDDGSTDHLYDEKNPNESHGLFVRLQSWSGDAKHPELDAFIGRKVRITIETID